MELQKKAALWGGALVLLHIGLNAAGYNTPQELTAELLTPKHLVERSVAIELGGFLTEAPPQESPPSTHTPTPTPPASDTPPPTPTPEILETVIAGGIHVDNKTHYNIDTAQLLVEGPSIRLTEGQPQILIIHTHSSEAYTMDEFTQYVPSDDSRTQDLHYNVVRVGDVLAEELRKYGLEVIHDREIYDYPSYTGSYTRTGASIERYLEKYPSISIVIDVHRDAIGSGDVVYKTMAEGEGEPCAQTMFVVGTDASGLEHPNWQENLKLALYLQSSVHGKHPTLQRTIKLVTERYNQQLTVGSLILEVGSNGNTLPEALNAIKLFAEGAGPALAKLVE